jgi:hypothetical protein
MSHSNTIYICHFILVFKTGVNEAHTDFFRKGFICDTEVGVMKAMGFTKYHLSVFCYFMH